jgi:hypothetical protein
LRIGGKDSARLSQSGCGRAFDALAVRVVLPSDGCRCWSVDWTQVSDDLERFDPKIFIFGGAIVAIAGFFMIHPYMPDVGPLENAMIGSIPIGNTQLPYRYVLVFATIVIGYGYYRLQISKDAKPR